MIAGLGGLLLGGLALVYPLSASNDPPAALQDIFSQDVERFSAILTSSEPARRIEGVQGLSQLKHWPSEERLIRLLDDPSQEVRRETVIALGRLGTGKSIPHLIAHLEDTWWEIRQNAWLGLTRMTAQNFAPTEKAKWSEWWGQRENYESTLVAAIPGGTEGISRRDALRALRHLAGPSSEPALLDLLRSGQNPALSLDERRFICEALERVGTSNAVPVLAGQHIDAAAWALGRIGGHEAEQALLKFPKILPVLIALDRLHSANAGSFLPHLVHSFGLVTFRSQPDDVHMHDPQPVQRVAANLILRSGHAPLLIELVLQELEDTMNPPIPHGPRPEAPEAWKRMFERMRQELKPGFVRDDGTTTTQPVTAVYHIASDPALVPRLIPLLKHPAYVPRVYVALLLGKLGAAEATPALIEIIREGYSFSDVTTLASGKHFEHSQTVRWRGFLCMALGRMGGDDARRALETFASDPSQPRDVRYSAVVGLAFIRSPESLPVLRNVAVEDIIWMVRDEALRAIEDIEILSREARL
jgi:hypothetical protein